MQNKSEACAEVALGKVSRMWFPSLSTRGLELIDHPSTQTHRASRVSQSSQLVPFFSVLHAAVPFKGTPGCFGRRADLGRV
jgi:hypothetical protein